MEEPALWIRVVSVKQTQLRPLCPISIHKINRLMFATGRTNWLQEPQNQERHEAQGFTSAQTLSGRPKRNCSKLNIKCLICFRNPRRSFLTLQGLLRLLDQPSCESCCSLRIRAQRKSFANRRKSTSLVTSDIVFHSQYHHVCFHQRLCPAIRKEKKNLHLDQRIRRRASGGHNKRASHTYVSCDAFALVASVSGPTPAEHYGCIQSIANVTSSFEGILGFMCDLSVSTFPGPTRTPQCR